MSIQKNLSRFKLVTFDITDTLLKFRRPPALQYAKKASDHGYKKVDQLKLSNSFRTSFKDMSTRYPNFGYNSKITWQDWWKQLVRNTFRLTDPTIPDKDVEKIAASLIHDFGTSECWLKMPGADDMVDLMKTHVKSVGVISNFDPRVESILKQMKIPDFNLVLNSYEVGHLKPNRQIFDRAIELCNIKPHEALHIGNTPLLDYMGATEAGWSSILISGEKIEWKIYPQIKFNHTFTTLADFTKALNTTEIAW